MDLFETSTDMVLLGVLLIGLSSGLLTLLTGRILSASRMIGSLLGGAEGVAATSIAFIGGVVCAPLVMTSLGVSPRQVIEADWPFLVAGGLTAGFAARWGGASLGGGVAGLTRRVSRSAALLIAILVSAVIGGYLQVLIGSGGVA